MNIKAATVIALLIVTPGLGHAGGYGWGAVLQGASRGLDDIEDRRAGRYDELRSRQADQEYEDQMAEERRLERQYREEELRLLREQNDMMRYRMMQSE